jgi:hypothetical protein
MRVATVAFILPCWDGLKKGEWALTAADSGGEFN